MKTILTLEMQLKAIKYLKKNPPVSGEGMSEITKRTSQELQIPLTDANLRTIMKAIGMKTSMSAIRGKGNNHHVTQRDKVIVESLLNIFAHISVKAPDSLVELARKMGYGQEP